MVDTDVDGLIETLMQLLDFDYPSPISKSPLILKEKDQIELLYNELSSLRTFLSSSEETRYTDPKVRDLVIRIIDVAGKVEDMVDSFVSSLVAKNTQGSDQDPCLDLGNIMQDIQSIKIDIESANHKAPSVLKVKGSSSRVNIRQPKEDKIVGFDVEIREIMERLVSDKKKLDIISIVGMGGLGKTTLANRVYNDPYATYHFYIRGWLTVSQTHEKRDLLSSLCKSLSINMKGEADEQSIAKFKKLIYQRLKGQRYLIVIDDIWSEEAWNDIRICFPDDSLGSRILVTTRLMNVALQIKPDSPVHNLRFLTMEDSWNLFQIKVFAEDGTCPINLEKIGKQIVGRCRGLPLAVLVISGLLAKSEKSVEFWTQVLCSIGSYSASEPEQYMNTLSLSYNHLPQHLKSCFLYFAAFKEDSKIDVRRLMWMWVAEGFVIPSTENVAKEYLIDLIDRSLVIVDQKKPDGGVKACRVHDLLHDLCLEKSKEQNFLGSGFSTNTSVCRRIFIHDSIDEYVSSKPCSPITRSFLYPELNDANILQEKSALFICSAFKHIRVLELGSVLTRFLPPEIGRLVQLRYLSLRTEGCVIPESVSTLWNLQTLVVDGYDQIDFPFCKDSSLPNLTNIVIKPYVRLVNPVALPKVQTITTLCLPLGRHPVLEMAPNLKNLGCIVSQKEDGSVLFPPLDTLVHLEKLNIEINIESHYNTLASFTCLDRLPHNLKKVTITRCTLQWKDLSNLGRLPNLETLRLLYGSNQGPRWDTNDGEFKKLKYLEIDSRCLKKWNIMSSDHFPALEKLVTSCPRLKKIPMCLGEIPTLVLIKLTLPSDSAADSARQIIEEQQSLGNDLLKLVMHDESDLFKDVSDDST